MDLKTNKLLLLSLILSILLLISKVIVTLLNSNELEDEIILRQLYLIDSKLIVEYYEDVDISNYISNFSVDILEVEFDTTTLGEKSSNIIYILDDITYNEEFYYEVVDTTSPVIIYSNSYNIEVNTDFDYTSKFIVADNYDKKAICTIYGDYDYTIIGSYNLEFECSDSSNNITEGEFILNIVEEVISTQYVATPITIEEVITTHKDINTQIGIDVSKWQGLIDYDEVILAGVEFVMIRAGYEDVNGNYIADEYFEYNLDNAKRVGLAVGIYFYSRSTTNQEAINQAIFVLDLLNGIELELPIVFDWEVWSSFNSYNISLADLNKMVDSFINHVEEYGYKGMNYGSANYLTKMFNNNHTTWLAHYTQSTYYTKDYLMWQLTDSGIVPGINSYVDLNVLYK